LLEIVTVGGVWSTDIVSVLLVAELTLPAASLNVPLATVITPLAELPAVGVNVAPYVVPLPEKLLSVPPVTEISLWAKSVADSLSLNVRVAACPDPSAVLLLEITMVGGVVSPARVTELLATAFVLPAASLKAPVPT
jgi:hypothetical protein